MSIIYCPICGKNIKYSRICSKCGYETKKDYEAYPTLNKIKKGIKSVEHKRQEYENKKLESYLAQQVYYKIKHNTEELQKLSSQVDMLTQQNDDLKKQLVEIQHHLQQTEASLEQFRNNNQIINDENITSQTTTEQVLTDYASKRKELQNKYLHGEKEKIEPNKTLKIGDSFLFGAYKQDTKGNEKKTIEWIVLDKKDNRVLLISKYALDCKLYNTKGGSTTWEKCSLRMWLNNNFISEAFASDERSKIVETKVTADRNPKYSTNPGKDTKDKVFLLSIDEAKKYYASDVLRQCKPTEFAISNNANKYRSGNCEWWLRSPGWGFVFASKIGSNGSIYYGGGDVRDSHIAVRPTMWINL